MKDRNNKELAKKNLKPLLLFFVFMILLVTLYIAFKASMNDHNIFSISTIALVAGLMFESFRISDSWKTVLGIFFGTYSLSLLSFLPGKGDHPYNFERHIAVWPYYFLLAFGILFWIFHHKKIKTKISEGLTQLLSISVLYWTIDYSTEVYMNTLSIGFFSVVVFLSIFSICNSFIHFFLLSERIRFILSVWSTLIMFALGINYTIRVFSQSFNGESVYLTKAIYDYLQYFLLGISTIYTIQNLGMLLTFLPSQNGNYKKDLEESKKLHLNRYSDQQVELKYSIVCILYSGGLYCLNHKYEVLPRHTMIWFVLLTFPLLLQLYDLLRIRKIKT